MTVTEGKVPLPKLRLIVSEKIQIQIAPEIGGEAFIGNGDGGLNDNAVITQLEPSPDIFAHD